MATYLYRLGRTAYRRWPIFLGAWLVLFVTVGALAASFGTSTSDNLDIPGLKSNEAAELQAELFPGSRAALETANINVVVAVPEGQRLDDPTYAARITALVADLAEGPQIPDDLASPESQAAINPVNALAGPPLGGPAAVFAPVTEDGRVGVISFILDAENVNGVDRGTQDAIEEAMDAVRGDGLTVEANGQGMAAVEPPGGVAEAIGIGVAILVLVLTFGSLVGAGLPILTAVFGVGLGLAGVTAMTALTDVSNTAPVLASMIGIAVGIDYSLFILARYRSELEHTDDREEAVGIAVGTAGSAVVFAGLTVLIALCALAVVGLPFLTSMGLAAAGTVLVAVLVALTLVPALLGLLKSKAFGGRVRHHRPKRDAEGAVLNNGVRWARLVGRRPVAVIVLSVVALGALAIPLKDLYLAFPTDSTKPASTTQRQASDLLAESFGPGREAPFQVIVDGSDLPESAREQAYADVARWAADQEGVVGAVDLALLLGTPQEGATPPGAQVLLVPAYSPDDQRTVDLLEALRAAEPDIEAATGTDIGITGLTAVTTDVSDLLDRATPIYLALVVGLAFLLLVLVFRSILVPLTATLGFLLSVLATLGATVAIFQQGAFGLVESQPIVSSAPIFIVGVVFGLAMDYQVFLVTRMREAHVHGMSTRDAVVDGFRNSARVVAAAAVIMIAVFSGFMFEPDPVTKMFGFSLAAAIVLDAFVVRMILIPAVMDVMGERAWWLPAWLDRLLPEVDVEGEKLERVHPVTLSIEAEPEPEPELAVAGR